MLKIRDLYVRYGGIEAVQGVSLDIKRGSIVTLVGANGAGKSSIIRSIAGLNKSISGEISLTRKEGDEPVSLIGLKPEEMVRRGISLSPEGRRILPHLTVVENLRLGAYSRTDKDGINEDIERVYALFPRLKERARQLAGTLSVKDMVAYTQRGRLGAGEEKIHGLYSCHGTRLTPLSQAKAGDLCVVLGLHGAAPGDGIGTQKDSLPYAMAPMLSAKVLCDPKVTAKHVLEVFRLLEDEEPMLTVRWEEQLQEMFGRPATRRQEPSSRRIELEALLPGYVSRLARKGTSVRELFREYHAAYPDRYQLSSFKRAVREYRFHVKVVGHVEYYAADQMYVDFAGDRLEVVDGMTGETKKAEIFVAILPFSHYTYCEAVWSQRKEDLIRGCENAMCYFEGVPAAIVPDNLRAAVARSDRNEPVINEDFAAFAEHYGCTVYPARVRHPKDKALV